MKLSKEEVKELFEQRTEEYLLNYNTTLQELKERTLKLFDEKNNPIIDIGALSVAGNFLRKVQMLLKMSFSQQS